MKTSGLRVLLLFPGIYSVVNTFKIGLEANGCIVKRFSYDDELTGLTKKTRQIVSRSPHLIRSQWENHYRQKINDRHLDVFKQFMPDLVIVYNSEMLSRSTVRIFKESCRVVFFMGDSPFFTPVNDEYLPCLVEADLILSPDTYWIEQLNVLGITKCSFFIPGSNPEDHYRLEDEHGYHSDLVFFGQPYSGAWGYKRVSLLNSLADLDIRIYTNGSISRWYGEFPKLEKRVYHTGGRISPKEHNRILNRSKLYPVDANPGLINGVHIRIIDCISSGVIPLAEYRKDVEQIFGSTMLPIIKSYKDASALAKTLLEDEELRLSTLKNLRIFVRDLYSPANTMGYLLDQVDL